MINKTQFNEIIEEYKKNFDSEHWAKESYKWEMVKHFQDNWDVNADDFAYMLKESLAKTDNILTSRRRFPATMIIGLAERAPEEVRSMFIDLFDESRDVYDRIKSFMTKSAYALETYWKGPENHFQDINSISTYLWLRYPDKYYIYKYTVVKDISNELESDYIFKKGSYANNFRDFLKLYDEIHTEISKDADLKSILKEYLTPDCYSDPDSITLTMDFGYYISKYYKVAEGDSKSDSDDDIENDATLYSDDWSPSIDEYNPGFTKEDWLNLFNSKYILGPVWGGAMAAFYDMGGAATCSQIAQKYNKSASSISGMCTQLAKRIHKETSCPISKRNNGQNRYWTILFQGKKADSSTKGSFMWKLRPELYDALTDFDILRFRWDQTGVYGKYTKEDFLNEVYISESKYNLLIDVIRKKKNIILQGAPGVGKTFAAKRIAYSLLGTKDEDKIQIVQFHQNYTYEDFVMGYKPTEDGFELKPGVFYKFCQKASEHPEEDYFFIIDEINRGNLSKIFGELLMLIEKDYRDTEVTLAYNGKEFKVPSNLYIIGMMNTADRSIAMIDYALRRRFSFFEMEPGFGSDGFIKYQKGLNNDLFDEVINKIVLLNDEISKDKSLGKGFCIGHSYFCGLMECDEDTIREIIRFDIIPMLNEYWFDDTEKIQRWENILYGVFQ